jgi:hypothetical protein
LWMTQFLFRNVFIISLAYLHPRSTFKHFNNPVLTHFGSITLQTSQRPYPSPPKTNSNANTLTPHKMPPPPLQSVIFIPTQKIPEHTKPHPAQPPPQHTPPPRTTETPLHPHSPHQPNISAALRICYLTRIPHWNPPLHAAGV